MTTKTIYNNRFNVLMDDENNSNILKIKNKKKINNIKKEESLTKDNNNNFNSFKTDKQVIREKTFLLDKKKREEQSQYELNTRRLRTEENIKKAKEQEIKILTNMDNFPELKTTNKASKNLQNTENVYKEKLIKNDNESSENDKIDTIVPDGCVCIEFDKKKNELIWKYGKNTIKNDVDSNNFDYNDNPYYVMDRLTRLIEKRRNEYINNWGVDDYENTFLFPNYNYNSRMFDYFDEN